MCGWFLASQVDAHAPWLLQLEFSDVLRTACRRGTLPIALARFNLTSYDAAYLELALRWG